MRLISTGRVAKRLREFYGTDENDRLNISPETFAVTFDLADELEYLKEYFDWTQPFELAQSITHYLPQTQDLIYQVLDLATTSDTWRQHQTRRKIRVLKPFFPDEFRRACARFALSEWEVLFSPEITSKTLKGFLHCFLVLTGQEEANGPDIYVDKRKSGKARIRELQSALICKKGEKND